MVEFAVERAKLVRYLLDPFHTDGGPKCRLFLHFGFRIDDPNGLANAFVNHATEHRPRTRLRVGDVDTKRVVTGALQTPSGRLPFAISIWQIMPDDRERLITAYIRET